MLRLFEKSDPYWNPWFGPDKKLLVNCWNAALGAIVFSIIGFNILVCYSLANALEEDCGWVERGGLMDAPFGTQLKWAVYKNLPVMYYYHDKGFP